MELFNREVWNETLEKAQRVYEEIMGTTEIYENFGLLESLHQDCYNAAFSGSNPCDFRHYGVDSHNRKTYFDYDVTEVTPEGIEVVLLEAECRYEDEAIRVFVPAEALREGSVAEKAGDFLLGQRSPDAALIRKLQRAERHMDMER